MKKLTLEDTQKMSPKGYWETFYQIAQIPHGSGNCNQIANFLEKKFASYNNCTVLRDKWDNLYIQVAPTPGKENWPSICLQGHMDMVCAKDPQSKHDFTKDPIELILEDNNTLHANNTTLGADDAISICAMVAILESGVEHGPLEFLITSDEESTTVGAMNLEPNTIQSPYLINLDIEHVDVVCFGCAGYLDYKARYEIGRENKGEQQEYYELKIYGLRGGHSGEEIHKKRANAIKMIFDFLFNLRFENKLNISLVSVNGGQAHNAIPMNCSAIFTINKSDVSGARTILNNLFEELKTELFREDTPNFSFEAKPDEKTNPIKQNRSDELIAAFNGMVDGLHRFDFRYGTMESSNNIGLIRTADDNMIGTLRARSVFDNAMWRLFHQIQAVLQLSNGTSTIIGHAKPWTPKPGRDPLVETYTKTMEKYYGKKIKVVVNPGTIEAGLIVANNPKIKRAIGCGLRLENWHTPKETMYIDTLDPFFKTMLELISTVNVWGK